jgi:hypothetical protein
MQGPVPEGGRSDQGEDPTEVGQKAEKSCNDYGPLADKPGFLVFRETLPANSPGLQRQRETNNPTHVIDYRHENVRDAGKRWDVVFDTVGVSSFAESESVLTVRGVFVPAVISIRGLFEGVWTPVTGAKRLVGGVSMNKREPLRYVAELLADDALRVVIDFA